MRTGITVTVAALLVGCATSLAYGVQAEVYDSPSLQEARAMAAEAGKPVLIQFYTPG